MNETPPTIESTPVRRLDAVCQQIQGMINFLDKQERDLARYRFDLGIKQAQAERESTPTAK